MSDNQTKTANNSDVRIIMLAPGERITVRYKNWRGEIAVRRIELDGVPIWARSEWHPEPQWLVWGSDLDAGGVSRLWAVKDMEPVTFDVPPPLPPHPKPTQGPGAVEWQPMADAFKDGRWMVFKLEGDGTRYYVQFGSWSKRTGSWVCMDNLTGRISECRPLAWWPFPDYMSMDENQPPGEVS
jgi:hypothetical protein